MYTSFIFGNGINPYIATTNKNLFQMICKYYIAQYDDNSFAVNGSREWNGQPTYQGKKELLRSFAIDWQNFMADQSLDYFRLAAWGNFFAEYGAKFGLLQEFRENGII